uniref:Putative YAH1-Ferredoxin of the mitochondrial matrix n=1 Tax=Kalmanozyma brasiliensis (strain GHG001) TaxID=1365824 RepID=V5GWD7_KALBG
MVASLTRTALLAATRALRRPTALPGPLPRFTPLRTFTTTLPRPHGGITRPPAGEGITINFVDPKGAPLKTVTANEGDDLLSIAHEYDIDLEGACEGSIACSTCHVILEPDVYDSLEEPCDDENDMLDLAFGLTDTSRLGCQVKVTKEQDGMKVQLPAATRNMYVDGK